jgi:predicted nucleic acid-binding protein
MASYFADTSFWVALVDKKDAYHAKAIELSLKINGNIVTTEAVLLETANTFSRPQWREKVVALISHIHARTDIEIVSFNWQAGWELFKTRPDKSWSLTDCISFEVMRDRRLTEALAADSHFQQAGFNSLMLDQR